VSVCLSVCVDVPVRVVRVVYLYVCVCVSVIRWPIQQFDVYVLISLWRRGPSEETRAIWQPHGSVQVGLQLD